MLFAGTAVVSSLFVFEVEIVSVGGFGVWILQPGVCCYLVAYLPLGIVFVLEEEKGIFQGLQ
jgi:hypothetical protein